MKIQSLELERFGVWRGVSLPFGRPGLHVLYGPNEAGKSTLMRFVRAVLYGFEPGRDAARRDEFHDEGASVGTAGGALAVEMDGRRWQVRRTLDVAARDAASEFARGRVEVRDGSGDGRARVDADDWLAHALGGVAESVYEKIFAVGLHELQQLGTLQADEVARQIHGVSLGLDGQRLLAAFGKRDAEAASLATRDGRGLLDRLEDREESLKRELARFAGDRDRYDALYDERDELGRRIARAQSELTDHDRQLRGMDLLQKAHEPWRQVEQLRGEIASLPRSRKFPERGLERLREIEADLKSTTERRDAARREYRRLRAELGAAATDETLDQRSRVRALVDQRDWLRTGVARVAEADNRGAQLKRELDERLKEIGPGWTLSRLEALDRAPAVQEKLLKVSRDYQRALRRRHRMQKRLKGWSRTCRVRAAEIADQVKRLGVASIDQALAENRVRTEDLRTLVDLRGKERDYNRRGVDLRDQLRSLQARLVYPEWLPMLLWFFGLGGFAASVLGFYQGFQQNGVAGLMWVFLGLTCGGLAWAVKSHYDVAVQETADPWHTRRQRLDGELQQIEQQIDKLERRSPWLKTAFVDVRASDDAAPWEGELRRHEERRLELEALAQVERRILSRRQRLSGLRQKFQQVNREVASTRQAWSQALRAAGLPETLNARDGVAAWQRVLDAKERWLEWRLVVAPAEDHRESVRTLEGRIAEVGRLLDVDLPRQQTSLDHLALLERRLDGLPQSSRRSNPAYEDSKRRRAEWRALSREVKTLVGRRSKLLREAGARSRREFERKATAFGRRDELKELLALAENELNSVGQAETELALTEDDLRGFDPTRQRERRAELASLRAASDRELREAYERLGSVKQELRGLETDRRASELRSALAEASAERDETSDRRAGLDLAAEALAAVRTDYEKTCQPATLAAASEWLRQLTRGRYRTVWTPLGQRDLRVEDEQGKSWAVEQLSSGTREQLFLAVRLALVKQLRDEGIDLPMVLDDVLVNFDQERTEAALETLRTFAEQGQQILLFTCHRHVAELGEGLGCESIRLPARNAETDAPAQRRAG